MTAGRARRRSRSPRRRRRARPSGSPSSPSAIPPSARTPTSPSSRTSSARPAATGSAAWRTSRRCGRGSSARRSNATLSELDRAYGGALAVYQNGEFESALRTLRAIVEDLESMPGERGGLRAVGARPPPARARRARPSAWTGEATLDEPSRAPTRPSSRTPTSSRPRFRRRFEAGEGPGPRAAARKLTVPAEGRRGTVFVNGRPMGHAPLSLLLPAGHLPGWRRRRVAPRPELPVDLEAEDRTVVLDFALAESLRIERRPGARARRPAPRATGSSAPAPGSASTSSSW